MSVAQAAPGCSGNYVAWLCLVQMLRKPGVWLYCAACVQHMSYCWNLHDVETSASMLVKRGLCVPRRACRTTWCRKWGFTVAWQGQHTCQADTHACCCYLCCCTLSHVAGSVQIGFSPSKLRLETCLWQAVQGSCWHGQESTAYVPVLHACLHIYECACPACPCSTPCFSHQFVQGRA